MRDTLPHFNATFAIVLGGSDHWRDPGCSGIRNSIGDKCEVPAFRKNFASARPSRTRGTATRGANARVRMFGGLLVRRATARALSRRRNLSGRCAMRGTEINSILSMM